MSTLDEADGHPDKEENQAYLRKDLDELVGKQHAT